MDKRREQARSRGGGAVETALAQLGLLPIDAVYRYFPDWPSALAAAHIADEQLTGARAAMLPHVEVPGPAPGKHAS